MNRECSQGQLLTRGAVRTCDPSLSSLGRCNSTAGETSDASSAQPPSPGMGKAA